MNLQPLDQQFSEYAELPQAAVVVLLNTDGTQLITIKKAAHLRRHAGEIAFAGGKLEAGESLLQCALRECREELGVSQHQLQLLGRLSPRRTRHHVAVHPFVAQLTEDVVFSLDVNEVASVLMLDLDFVKTPGNLLQRDALIDGKSLRLAYYHYQGEKIWGVTAQIIRQLVEAL
jgi:8-oxo-dGTP pyrophosphatase MutT (NUDIX family)